MAEKRKKKPNYRLRLILLRIGSFIVSALPLVILFVVRFDTYTATPAQTVKLCFGGVLALTLILLNVLKRLKFPNGFVLCVTMLILVYFLKDVLVDILLILLMETIGQLIDFLVFSFAIKKTEEERTAQKTADKTTEEIKEVLDGYFGRT